MRRNLIVIGFGIILTIGCAANVAFAAGASNLNLGHVRMDRFDLDDASGTSGRSLYLLTVFVPTNGNSRNCLATLNGASNHSLIESVYCEYRPNNPYGNGLVVVVKFQWEILKPDDDNWCDVKASVTFFQDGATYYGAPISNAENPPDISSCQ